MDRVVVNLAAAWALVVMPSLCVAGLLEHPCECAESTCCPSDCECTDDSRCGHEAECSDDPCAGPVVRGERQGDRFTAAAPAAPAAGFGADLDSFRFPRVAQTIPASTVASGDLIRLPRPPSDVPLLI